MDNREELEKSGNIKPREKLGSSTESCGFFNGTLNYLQSYHQTLQLAQKLSNVVKAPHHFNPRGLPSAWITPFSHTDIKQKYTIPKKSDTMLNWFTDNPHQSINNNDQREDQLRQRLNSGELIAGGRTNIEDEGKTNQMDPVLLGKNLGQDPAQNFVERDNYVKFQNYKKNENFSRSRRKRNAGSRERDKSTHSFQQSGNANERFRTPRESSITLNESSSVASSTTLIERSRDSIERSRNSVERSTVPTNQRFHNKSFSHERFCDRHVSKNRSLSQMYNKSTVIRKRVTNQYDARNSRDRFRKPNVKYESRNKHVSKNSERSTARLKAFNNCYKDEERSSNSKTYTRCEEIVKTAKDNNKVSRKNDQKLDKTDTRANGHCNNIINDLKSSESTQEETIKLVELDQSGKIDSTASKLQESPEKKHPVECGDELQKVAICKLCQKTFRNKAFLSYHERVHYQNDRLSLNHRAAGIHGSMLEENLANVKNNIEVVSQNQELTINAHSSPENKVLIKNRIATCNNPRDSLLADFKHPKSVNAIEEESISIKLTNEPQSVCEKVVEINAAVVLTEESPSGKTPSKEVSKVYSDSLHKCSVCQKCFKRKCYLVNHERSHLNKPNIEKQSEANSSTELRTNGEFVCQICPRKFTRKCHLAVHSISHKNKEINQNSNKNQMGYDTCNNPTKNRFQIKIGRNCRRTCNKVHIFTCQICDKYFTVKEKFLKHKTSCNKNFYNILDESFVARIILSRRRRQLQKEKPNKCLDCGKRFRKWEKFQKHRQIHSRELNRYFKCRFCGSFFSQLSELKVHKLKHKYDVALSLPNVQIKEEPSDNMENLVDETPQHFNFQKQYSNFLESVLPCSDNIKVEHAGAVNQSDEDPIRHWIIPFTNFELIKSVKRTKPFSFYNVHQEPVNLNNIYLDVLEISARSNGPIECKVPASSLKELTKKMTLEIQDMKHLI